MNGIVYLVGAGCGSADLITVRGRAVIQLAEVLVYDALIDPELIGLAPEAAEKISVGKRAGKHSAKQEDISKLLVEKALEGRTVVRLKGGDPFVFGRGGEEIMELQKYGILYSIIPGISSGIAAPELAGIALTHRQLSRSFTVITAHTADTEPDFRRYAAIDGTLVFLMGLGRLEAIARGLIEGGLSPSTPAAVVSKGATPQQRTVRAALGEISNAARGLEAPAVIVVGEAAALDLAPRLRGSVSLTGTTGFQDRLSNLLYTSGFEINRLPPLKLRKKRFTLPVLENYSHIILTSANGAQAFAEKLEEQNIDHRALYGIKLAVIGPQTARRLKSYGFYADIMPDEYTSAALAACLAKDKTLTRALILRAENGASELTAGLSAADIAFDEINTYSVRPSADFGYIKTDYIVFGSALGVRSFFGGGGSFGPDTRAVLIGPSTAGEFEKQCEMPYLTADSCTSEGIVNKILEDTNEKI